MFKWFAVAAFFHAGAPVAGVEFHTTATFPTLQACQEDTASSAEALRDYIFDNFDEIVVRHDIDEADDFDILQPGCREVE